MASAQCVGRDADPVIVIMELRVIRISSTFILSTPMEEAVAVRLIMDVMRESRRWVRYVIPIAGRVTRPVDCSAENRVLVE